MMKFGTIIVEVKVKGNVEFEDGWRKTIDDLWPGQI